MRCRPRAFDGTSVAGRCSARRQELAAGVVPGSLTSSLQRGGRSLASSENENLPVAGSSPSRLGISALPDLSEGAASGRGASAVPQMCPKCVRVFLGQTTTKYQFAGTLGKPSDGLEPSTPSLPWRSMGGTRVHARALAATFLLQIGSSSCVSGARACPPVPRLVYPSRTRGSLAVCKTDNVRNATSTFRTTRRTKLIGATTGAVGIDREW